VLNLIDNAIKYAAEGKKIELALKRAGERIVLTVRDFGPGIDPEEHASIFERFYRAKAMRLKPIRGSGIGLALVQHIARAHGGDVAVRRTPGRAPARTVAAGNGMTIDDRRAGEEADPRHRGRARHRARHSATLEFEGLRSKAHRRQGLVAAMDWARLRALDLMLPDTTAIACGDATPARSDRAGSSSSPRRCRRATRSAASTPAPTVRHEAVLVAELIAHQRDLPSPGAMVRTPTTFTIGT
jgi:hypothetical protein